MLDIVLHAVLQDKKHVKALVIQIRHFLLSPLLPIYPPYTSFSPYPVYAFPLFMPLPLLKHDVEHASQIFHE